MGPLQLPIYGFQAQAAFIPLLYVCRESFAVASKIYTRAFGTAEAYPETWFAFDRDMLYLDFNYLLGDLSLDVKKVENLTVCAQPVSYNDRFFQRGIGERYMAEILTYFGKGKTLTLVNSQHESLNRRELVFTDVSSTGGSFLCFRGLDAEYSRSFDKRVALRRLSQEEVEWHMNSHFHFRLDQPEHYRINHSEES